VVELRFFGGLDVEESVAAAHTFVAGSVAWTVHVPTATSVMVDPDTVQAPVVCELKLTEMPDVEVALRVNKPH
jgi:hypothetical protein